MPERFISLANWLAPASCEPMQPLDPSTIAAEQAQVTQNIPDEYGDAIAAALSEVRRFRAALADALDAAIGELAREIAIDIVGRELHCAPVELRAIVQQARKRYGFDEPIAIRAHPDDCEQLRSEAAPVVADARLRRGDVVIEVATGTIDATLGARLDRLLATRESP